MATDKRTRLMDSSGENPSLGLEWLPGSRGPLANPLDLGRRDPGASMHQEVRPGRHDPFPQIAADPAQSLSRSRLSLRVGPHSEKLRSDRAPVTSRATSQDTGAIRAYHGHL